MPTLTATSGATHACHITSSIMSCAKRQASVRNGALNMRIGLCCGKRVTMSPRLMREELREAREAGGAAVGVAVWTPKHAPAGTAPFTMVGDDVHVVVDPEAPDTAYLEAAIRLARLLALATLREREVDVDAAAIGRALAGVREQLEVVRAMKVQLTSVSTATQAVSTSLDALRTGILTRVAEAEAELRLQGAAAAA